MTKWLNENDQKMNATIIWLNKKREIDQTDINQQWIKSSVHDTLLQHDVQNDRMHSQTQFLR